MEGGEVGSKRVKGCGVGRGRASRISVAETCQLDLKIAESKRQTQRETRLRSGKTQRYEDENRCIDKWLC